MRQRWRSTCVRSWPQASCATLSWPAASWRRRPRRTPSPPRRRRARRARPCAQTRRRPRWLRVTSARWRSCWRSWGRVRRAAAARSSPVPRPRGRFTWSWAARGPWAWRARGEGRSASCASWRRRCSSWWRWWWPGCSAWARSSATWRARRTCRAPSARPQAQASPPPTHRRSLTRRPCRKSRSRRSTMCLAATRPRRNFRR
mmetsp:Transcript_13267/g.41590  ORF Transcript_13267/g.41590 Transcript_13267/m.41590 type:complete len:202 (+) Transcript_13267:536-1141(+)